MWHNNDDTIIKGQHDDTIIKDIAFSINIITLIYIMFQYNDTCMK